MQGVEKMKNHYQIIFGLMFFFISGLAWGSGVTAEGTISYLELNTNSVFVQKRDGAGNLIKTDPDSCGRDYGFQLSLSHPNFNALSSGLLSAYVSGKKVTLNLNGCAGTPGDTWPLISYVIFGSYGTN